MAKRTKKSPGRRRTTQKPEILESITGNNALSILKVLAQRDVNMKRTIENIAMEVLSGVNVDEIAVQVQTELEFLQVEDVWARAGAAEYGYVDPGDAAWEMFEEALRPFREEVEKYKQLLMSKEGMLFCQGILKGIYDFDKDSSTEYKDWAVDAPCEYFGIVLDDCKKLCKGRTPLAGMRDFLETHCPDWYKWAVKAVDSRRR